MLKSLKLKNLALIEIIEIKFEKGLNVFTGESGSGKSLILDSLNALFGGTNIPLNHLIRPGTNECLIEARFSNTPLLIKWYKNNKLRDYFDEILVCRESYKKNNKIKTKYKVNGNDISKKNIQSLGQLLLDFAGQNDNIKFNSQDYLKSIIDDLGPEELKLINHNIKENLFQLNDLKKNFEFKSQKLQKDKNYYFKNINTLKILEDANLQNPNEIEELKQRRYRLLNNVELINTIKDLLKKLSDSEIEQFSANAQVYESIKQLNKAQKYDSNLNEFSEKLIKIHEDLDSLIFSLTEYLNQICSDDENLEIVQNRLFELENLEKDFSLELPKLIKKRDELKIDNNYENLELDILNLQRDINTLSLQLEELLIQQKIKRKIIAKNLQKKLLEKLQKLGLVNSVFEIIFMKNEVDNLNEDRIDFLFSANPDQPMAPISKLISGGEMSRFLLALKFSISDIPNTLFLDEIDNGLSGKSLFSLVELIKDFSSRKQVLCITHHPLLASMADAHFKVHKNLYEGETFTQINQLVTQGQRQLELVDLIGGGFSEANEYALTLLRKSAA